MLVLLLSKPVLLCLGRCWCGDGDSLNGEKLDDEDCDYECTGNPETSCGGYLRISVYKTSG